MCNSAALSGGVGRKNDKIQKHGHSHSISLGHGHYMDLHHRGRFYKGTSG